MKNDTSGQRIARVFGHLIKDPARAGLAAVIDTDANYHYQVGWDDAVAAAARIVNEARFDSRFDLSELVARIRDLKDGDIGRVLCSACDGELTEADQDVGRCTQCGERF